MATRVPEMSKMIERINKHSLAIYPHIDDEKAIPHNGRVFLTTDRDVAPEVAGRLQLQIQYSNGMDRETWEQLKAAGDRAFEWAEGQ